MSTPIVNFGIGFKPAPTSVGVMPKSTTGSNFQKFSCKMTFCVHNEGMRNHFESPKEDPNEKQAQELSRREFLKRGGKAATLALLPFGATVCAEISPAWSKEMERHDSWFEGLQALQDEVFNADATSMALFVKDEAEGEVWKYFSEAEGHRPQSVPRELVKVEAATPGVTDIKAVHTHPLKTFKKFFTESGLTDKSIKIPEGERGHFPIMPPSIDDVLTTIALHSSLDSEKTLAKVSEFIVDPRGVWKYTPDLTHNFPKMYALYELRRADQLADLTEDAVVLQILIEQESIADAETLLSHLKTKEWERISPAMQTIVTELISGEEELEKTLQPFREAVAGAIKKSYETGVIDIKNISSAYKELGVQISFTSFDELGKSEKEKSI